MAVEALIDGMHHRSIRMGVHPFRRAVYDELRKTLKVLTAEGIYRELKKADYRPEQRARMVQEFCIDDHTYWAGSAGGGRSEAAVTSDGKA